MRQPATEPPSTYQGDSMSTSPDSGFGKFVPGFDFLQNLAKTAAAGASSSMPQMPNLANWVSPSLNLEELEKRVEELKAVHFWLDQNSKALGATIQALEVQKMTLATLKGMNFNMGDVANAFKLKAADSVVAGVQKVTERAASAAKSVTGAASDMASSVKDAAKSASKNTSMGDKAKPASGIAGLVDPMQLWGSLTQQFQQIAASAMKDAGRNTAIDATKHMVDGLAKEAAKATKRMGAGAAKKKAPAKKAARK
jgi:hypothetical protein